MKNNIKLKTWEITFVSKGSESRMRVNAETFNKAVSVVYNYYPSPSTGIRSVKEQPYAG